MEKKINHEADVRVLLLSPPYLPEYMRNARCDFVSLSATQWYPILLGYCGAWLEKCGYNVKLIDAPAYYLDHKVTEKIVLDYKPDFLVVYTGLKSQDNDIEIADALTEKAGCETIFVGPYASINPEEIFKKSRCVNKVVTGEFELPIQEIIEKKPNEDIKNLIYKEGEKIFRNEERPYLSTAELDQFPFVSGFFKNHLDIYRYKTISEYYPFIDIMTGRGCKWGLCTFCLWVYTYIKGPAYNLRSIDNVIEEFKFIKKELPKVRSVMIQDDTFTEERAMEFSEAKIRAKIDLPWSCYARGNISYEVLCTMKRSGCRNLHVGYESGDPNILRSVKKGVTRERMTKFTADAKRAGLRIHGDFAIGFPGESAETCRATINWAKELNPHTAQFQLMIPYPATPYYNLLKQKDWLNENGEPDYPEFSNEEIRAWARKAYRSYYLSHKYLWKAICHPYEHFFGRMKAISRAIPAMFWRRWKV